MTADDLFKALSEIFIFVMPFLFTIQILDAELWVLDILLVPFARFLEKIGLAKERTVVYHFGVEQKWQRWAGIWATGQKIRVCPGDNIFYIEIPVGKSIWSEQLQDKA